MLFITYVDVYKLTKIYIYIECYVYINEIILRPNIKQRFAEMKKALNKLIYNLLKAFNIGLLRSYFNP